MKIAMVSEHASPLATLGGTDAGGQNVHVDALAAGLAGLGHQVTVFTRRDALGPPPRVAMPGGYVVEHVPVGPPTEVPKDDLWPFIPAFGEYLAERWSQEPIDVAHSHFWMSGAATKEAARATSTPWAHTFHALGSVKLRHQGLRDTSPAERIEVEADICRSADLIIATCTDEVNELDALGMSPERTRVIPCGVDDRLFTAQAPRPTNAPPRIVTVGRLVERKGIADAIFAVAQLPAVELVIVGGPDSDALTLDPEVKRLRRLAEQADCLERVKFLGGVSREDMPGVFGAADIVAVTPWYEPFGIVPLEAMACARPVVGTAVGGLLDTVVPGRTGELVSPHSPDELAAAFDSLLSDRDRRVSYGLAGAQRVSRKFTWRTVARQTEKTLTALAETSLTVEVKP